MARSDFERIGEKAFGHGQFGSVYRAKRRSDGLVIALKVVLANLGTTAIEAERHGAILQQRFGELHRMVPQVYEYGLDEDGDFYIAMELVEGISLEATLRHGALPPRDAVSHAMWLCDFLENAHRFVHTVEGKPYRLLHNDLKPAHVIVSPSGDRKILDFGTAKALEETRDRATEVARTTAYAAPERLLSQHVDVHADFWSLGVMLYEMVSGHRPYPQLEGERFRRQLYEAITKNHPRAPLPDDCPRHLAAIVNKLLAYQPHHRYQTAADIRADLERFLRDEPPLAAHFYDTPATTPIVRPSAPIPATEPVPVPATVPVPAGASVGVVDAVGAATLRGAVVRRSIASRLGWTFAAMTFVVLVATEGVACIFAERLREDVATIDERTVTARKESYASIARWSLLDLGLRTRVKGRLTPALRAVGDRVIADYRRESPAMGPAEWRQAYEALTWARDLAPRDGRLRSKQLIADAHVQRFAARDARAFGEATLAYRSALDRFREAAAADERSFDAYLGMAVIQVYGLSDVDAASVAIEQAVKRGYTSTRRETALVADGHLRRGRTSRRASQVLTGEQRRRELVKARGDFERCVTLFESIVEFGRAAQNLEICKANIRQIDQQLDVVE
jgi:hypothetical protein